MDFSRDPHPIAEPVANISAVPAANPTPTDSTALTHPSYAEMITAAIGALKEPNGSTKRTLAKYVESNFVNLPSNHSALLTQHLKRMRDDGQIVLVKHSYQLPRSVVSNYVSVNGTACDSTALLVPKKRPGRPPKAQSVHAAVPVFIEPPLVENNAAAGIPREKLPQNEPTGKVGSVGTADEPGTNGIKRGRGRPPKHSGVKRGVGRPPKTAASVQNVFGSRRGRPRKNAIPNVAGSSKPRGRPPKPSNEDAEDGGVFSGGGIVPVSGKRRGRPPKAGVVAKKRRKLSGKPLGRPRKNLLGGEGRTPDSHLLKAYLDVKGKLDHFQSTMRRSLSVLKPQLMSESAITALQELETLATMDISTSKVQPRSSVAN